MEHQADRCPHKPPAAKQAKGEKLKSEEPCRKFNNNDENCSFDFKCKFPHKWYSFGGPHPYPRCPRVRKLQAKDRNSKAS